MEIRKQTLSRNLPSAKQRNLTEITEYLDSHWSLVDRKGSLERAKELNQALGLVSEKVPVLLVTGTNGKSLTVHLAAKLLKEEGLKVGTFSSPHVLTYNERISINNEAISNKLLTEIANDVINTAEHLNINANSSELLTLMALKYFADQAVDVAVLEVDQGGGKNSVNICNSKILTITRVTAPNVKVDAEQLKETIKDISGLVKPGTLVVSGDQSKSHLQYMQELTEANKGVWAMPIRKLAALPYPFEQLHGRCAALAERIAQMYIEYHFNDNATITSDSLLSKPRGQRGRPTLEAKKHLELNPKKTLEQFWKEEASDLPCRFELLDKEKPSVLLDNASNIDAFKNVLLGIRLLHYQKPLKGLTIIVGAAKDSLHNEEFLKLVRYFFKKTSGQLFICPIDSDLPGTDEEQSWDVEKVTNDVKSMKIKARACKTFEEAFELAKKSVDERNGLIVITGSKSIVNNYWLVKGIKKLQ